MPTIPQTNQALFPIGLGAMPLSITNRPSENDAIKVIEKFLALGGNFIDTADVYGLNEDDKGHNEKLVIHALKQLSPKQDILLATKGGATRPGGAGWGMRGGLPTMLRKACEQSLLNLQISQHQLYYLHGPDPDVPIAESIGELVRLQEEGKIANIGISNVDMADLFVALRESRIFAVQNRCNPFCKGDIKSGLIYFCKTNDMLYVPYCPLGGWAEHAKIANSTLFKKLMKKYSVSSYVICLAWIRQLGENIIPIPGMLRVDQVAENVKAVDVQLDQDDVKLIADLPDLYSPKHSEQAAVPTFLAKTADEQ